MEMAVKNLDLDNAKSEIYITKTVAST